MKRLMMVALVAMLAGACKNPPAETAPTVRKADQTTENTSVAVQNADGAVFREPEPEGGWPGGIPPTLTAAANKHWRYRKRISTGLLYVEMRFFTDHLLMKAQEGQPVWDTVYFELQGDTIFPQRKNKQTGELEGTNDFFIIHRVWGDNLHATSYNRDDPSKITDLPFQRVVASADPVATQPEKK